MMPVLVVATVVSTAAVTALAGCSGQRVSGLPIGSTLAPTTSTVLTTTDPPPAEPTVPKAADGTNLRACYDGTCEVEVRAPVEIDFAPKTGLTHLSIPRIDPSGVHMRGTTAGGGQVTMDLYADPGTYVVGVIDNKLSIRALVTAGGHAVLRFAPV